jgi:hypothetical protein
VEKKLSLSKYQMEKCPQQQKEVFDLRMSEVALKNVLKKKSVLV